MHEKPTINSASSVVLRMYACLETYKGVGRVWKIEQRKSTVLTELNNLVGYCKTFIYKILINTEKYKRKINKIRSNE